MNESIKSVKLEAASEYKKAKQFYTEAKILYTQSTSRLDKVLKNKNCNYKVVIEAYTNLNIAKDKNRLACNTFKYINKLYREKYDVLNNIKECNKLKKITNIFDKFGFL